MDSIVYKCSIVFITAQTEFHKRRSIFKTRSAYRGAKKTNRSIFKLLSVTGS